MLNTGIEDKQESTMPQIINTNIASINAQRNLNGSQGDYNQALERLSSGLRINSAKDDAAGLAISTRFTSQTRGLNVAIRNAGDGVSLSQTAEGALGAMTDNLLRIRDLALQSANATNSAIDRQALNTEVQQLKEEIQRIAEQTNFNGTKLLDGTFSDVTFQIGANEGESLTFGIAQTTTDVLGTAATDGITSNAEVIPTITGAAQALAAGDLVINGIAVPASTGVDDSFSNVDNEKSAIAKAAAINEVSDQTEIEAIVNETSIGGTTGFTSADRAGTLQINGIDVALSTAAGLSVSVNLENVAAAINEKSGQTGVVATFNGNPTTGISLVAEDGRNISITGDGTVNSSAYGLPASLSTGATTDATNSNTYIGTYTLVSSTGKEMSLDTNANIGNSGLQVGTFGGNNSGAISETQPAIPMATGDIVINGVPVGPSLSSFDTASSTGNDYSAISKAGAINEVSDRTGVTAEVNSAILNADAAIAGVGSAITGSFELNGVQVNLSWSAADSAADVQGSIVDAVNNKSGQSGISAEAFGSSYRLIADDGRNVVAATFTGLTAANIGLTTNQAANGSVTLLSAGKIELSTLTGAIATNSGFEVGSFGSAEDGQLIQDVDISTVDGAIAALNAVDNALDQINFTRADLGAVQNRFESTIDTQAITAENLTTANSRIRDADFASETANLSRASVLQSAGLSVLSQANAQPQQVLQLLQG